MIDPAQVHARSTRRCLPGSTSSRWCRPPEARSRTGWRPATGGSGSPGWAPAEAAGAVRAFLAAEEVLVERMTKKGLRTFDCRAAVVSLTSADEPDAAGRVCVYSMVLRHGTPAVRPDDVLAGLRAMAGLEAAVAPVHQRVAQGPLAA